MSSSALRGLLARPQSSWRIVRFSLASDEVEPIGLQAPLRFFRFKATGARTRPICSNPAQTGGSGQTAPAHWTAIAPQQPDARGLNGEKQKYPCLITYLADTWHS